MRQAQLFDAGAHAFREHQGVLEAGIHQHHHELLAAVTGHEILTVLGHGAGNRGHGFQAVVAGQVPVGVVVLLEEIDIEQHQGDAFGHAAPAETVQHLVEAVFHAAAVQAAGETVHGGLVLKDAVGGVQLVAVLKEHVLGQEVLAQQTLVDVLAEQTHAGAGHRQQQQHQRQVPVHAVAAEQRQNQNAEHRQAADGGQMEGHAQHHTGHQYRQRGLQEQPERHGVVHVKAHPVAGQRHRERHGQAGHMQPAAPVRPARDQGGGHDQHHAQQPRAPGHRGGLRRNGVFHDQGKNQQRHQAGRRPGCHAGHAAAEIIREITLQRGGQTQVPGQPDVVAVG